MTGGRKRWCKCIACSMQSTNRCATDAYEDPMHGQLDADKIPKERSGKVQQDEMRLRSGI